MIVMTDADCPGEQKEEGAARREGARLGKQRLPFRARRFPGLIKGRNEPRDRQALSPRTRRERYAASLQHGNPPRSASIAALQTR